MNMSNHLQTRTSVFGLQTPDFVPQTSVSGLRTSVFN